MRAPPAQNRTFAAPAKPYSGGIWRLTGPSPLRGGSWPERMPQLHTSTTTAAASSDHAPRPSYDFSFLLFPTGNSDQLAARGTVSRRGTGDQIVHSPAHGKRSQRPSSRSQTRLERPRNLESASR